MAQAVLFRSAPTIGEQLADAATAVGSLILGTPSPKPVLTADQVTEALVNVAVPTTHELWAVLKALESDLGITVENAPPIRNATAPQYPRSYTRVVTNAGPLALLLINNDVLGFPVPPRPVNMLGLVLDFASAGIRRLVLLSEGLDVCDVLYDDYMQDSWRTMFQVQAQFRPWHYITQLVRSKDKEEQRRILLTVLNLPDVPAQGLPNANSGLSTATVDLNNLTIEHQRQFYNALLSAFPSPEALNLVLRLGVGTPLANITTANGLENMVLDVLTWTVSQGKVKDLLQAALEQNPGNPTLQQFARSAGIVARPNLN